MTDTYPENVSYHLITAQILIKLKQFSQAKKIIESLYSKYPTNSKISTSYALLQLNLGKLDIAKQVLTEVLKEDENNNQSALLLAKVEYQLGNKEAAIAGFERQAKILSVKNIALTELANIYIEEQEWQIALLVIDQILSENRLNIQALFKKAEVLLLLEQPKESKKKLNILAGLVDENVPMLMKLSQLQLQVGDLSGAEYSQNKESIR